MPISQKGTFSKIEFQLIRKVWDHSTKYATAHIPEFISSCLSGLIIGLIILIMQNVSDAKDDDRAISLDNLAYIRSISEQKVQKAPLQGIELSSITVSGIPLPQGDWSYASINNSKFMKTVMPDSNFHRARFRDTEILLADLSNSNFSNGNFDTLKFVGTEIRKTDFSNSVWDGPGQTGSQLESVNASGSDFSNTRLLNFQVVGSNLRNVDLQNAYLGYGTSIRGVDLRGANLRGMTRSRIPYPYAFSHICYDQSTILPKNFNLPPSSEKACRASDDGKLPDISQAEENYFIMEGMNKFEKVEHNLSQNAWWPWE